MNVETRARDAANDVLAAVDLMQRSQTGIDSGAGSIEGFRGFEARRRRTQQAAAVAVAIAIAALGFAGLLRAFRSQPVPAGQPAGTIAPEDLGRLELEWVGRAGPPGALTVAAVGEAVLVGVGRTSLEPSHVAVFEADCASSGERCEPARVIPTDFPVDSIVRDGDTVAIVTDFSGTDTEPPHETITAYPVACLLDEGPCPASWSVEGPRVDWDVRPSSPSRPPDPLFGEHAVAIRDGVLFRTEGSRLVAYVDGEGPVPIAELRPLRYRDYYTGDTVIVTPSQPILAGDSVVVAADRIYAFPVSCALDPGVPCARMWQSQEPGRSPYGSRGRYTGPLSVRDGLVFARTIYSALGLFPVDCREDGGVCEPLDRFYWPTPDDPVAVDDDVAYGASGATLTAGSISCDAKGCVPEEQPLWVGMLWDGPPGAPPGGETRPLAVGGSVFVAPREGQHIFAFDGQCGSGGERCEADWTYVTSGLIRTEPVVAGGRLLVGLGNGEVLSFAPGDGGTPLGSIWIAAAVLGLAAGLAVANRFRTRRAMRPGRGRQP